jgi:hypothetical protein
MTRGPTGIDKTPFVKDVCVSMDENRTEEMLASLEKCLVNVNAISLYQFPQPCLLERVWKMLHNRLT